MFSAIREPFNCLSHLCGAIAAFFGSIVLIIVGWTGTARIISLVVYGLSLVGLFSTSAIYHMVQVEPRFLQTLRKFDHSAIYLLIAGTYTPICVNVFSGFFRWGLLTIIWIIALGGILVKIFYINAPRWLNASVYVIMGWLCLSAVGQLSTAFSPAALTWLIAGGVIYTLGAVVYALKLFDFVPGRFGFHEIWHLFVLFGAVAHYIAVMLLIIRPV